MTKRKYTADMTTEQVVDMGGEFFSLAHLSGFDEKGRLYTVEVFYVHKGARGKNYGGDVHRIAGRVTARNCFEYRLPSDALDVALEWWRYKKAELKSPAAAIH